MIMLVMGKNRHIEFAGVLRTPAIRVGVAVSPQGVVVGFWKYSQSILRV